MPTDSVIATTLTSGCSDYTTPPTQMSDEPIENNLHWHLDVTFKEDKSRVRTGYAPQNLSMIRKLALQIIKNHEESGKKKRSIRKKLFMAAMNPDYLLQIIKNANF